MLNTGNVDLSHQVMVPGVGIHFHPVTPYARREKGKGMGGAIDVLPYGMGSLNVPLDFTVISATDNGELKRPSLNVVLESSREPDGPWVKVCEFNATNKGSQAVNVSLPGRFVRVRADCAGFPMGSATTFAERANGDFYMWSLNIPSRYVTREP